MEEYGKIAIEEANRQLALAENNDEGQNALPDEENICLRIPGVDPRGQYSSLDMALKQRTQRLDAVLNLRDESVRALVSGVLTNAAVTERWKAVKRLAKRQRVFTRAAKLCRDEAAANSLHRQIAKLGADPVAAELDAVLQGLEYLLGIREGNAPAEIRAFYRDKLGAAFTAEQREAAGRRTAQGGERLLRRL